MLFEGAALFVLRHPAPDLLHEGILLTWIGSRRIDQALNACVVTVVAELHIAVRRYGDFADQWIEVVGVRRTFAGSPPGGRQDGSTAMVVSYTGTIVIVGGVVVPHRVVLLVEL